MSVTRLASLGVTAYLVFLISSIPARNVIGWLGDSLAPVNIQGTSGTLWSAHSEQLELDTLSLSRVDWGLRLFPLLYGCVEIGFEHRTTDLSLNGSAGRCVFSSAYVDDLEARVAVDWIARQSGKFPLQLAGNVQLDIDSMGIDAGTIVHLDGSAETRDLAIAGEPNVALGDAVATATTTDGTVTIALSSRDGPMRLDGQLTLDAERNYQFAATLATTADADPQLKEFLSMLGRPGRNGEVELKHGGQY